MHFDFISKMELFRLSILIYCIFIHLLNLLNKYFKFITLNNNNNLYLSNIIILIIISNFSNIRYEVYHGKV